jgi:putative addiction module antidote
MPIALRRRVRKIGNSLGVGLPPEVVELLKVEEGDTIEFHASDGDIVIRRGK